MPSTKMRKKSIKVAPQIENATKQIRTYGEFLKEKQRGSLSQALKQIDEKYKICLSMIDKEDLQKTLGQLRKERETSMNRPFKTSNPKDEGYITECPGFSTTQSSRCQSLSRSNITNYTAHSDDTGPPMRAMGPPSSFRNNRTGNRRRSSSVPFTASRTSRARYKTPISKKATYPAVTPKVAPNTPLILLRKPRPGEFLMSMDGSPILVNSISTTDQMANCNIPLQDGTTLSLLPGKFRQSSTYLPVDYVEPQTVTELQNLHENLGLIVKQINKEKRKK